MATVEAEDIGLDPSSTDPRGVAKIVIVNAVAALEQQDEAIEAAHGLVLLCHAIVQKLKSGEPFSTDDIDSIAEPLGAVEALIEETEQKIARALSAWTALGQSLG